MLKLSYKIQKMSSVTELFPLKLSTLHNRTKQKVSDHIIKYLEELNDKKNAISFYSKIKEHVARCINTINGRMVY